MTTNQKIVKGIAGFVVCVILGAIGQALIMMLGSSGWVLAIHIGGSMALIAASLVAFFQERARDYAIGALLFCLVVLVPVLLVYSRVFTTGSLMD